MLRSRREWMRLAALSWLLLAVCSFSWTRACAQEHATEAEHATPVGASGQDHAHDDQGAAAESHGQGGDHGSGESGSPITWETDLAVWSLFVFLLLVVVLGKYAWRPLVEALDARERNLREAAEGAERARQEAERLLGEHQKKLDLVQDEVRAILEEARRDAQHTAQEMLGKAELEARALHERTLRDVERAKDQALREIAETAATLVTQTASRLIAATLNEQDHRRLIETSLAEFGRGNGDR